MNRVPPPPVLDSARVISYAFVDDVPFRKWGALIVEGRPLEHVPCLAIAANAGGSVGPMLFHCDGHWNVLGCTGGDAVDELKARAEKNYPGVGTRWVDVE